MSDRGIPHGRTYYVDGIRGVCTLPQEHEGPCYEDPSPPVRPVPGEENYWASDDGKIIGPMGHFLLPVLSRGYERVRIRGRDVYVHVAILESFRGPRPTKAHQGCHGDGDKRNNRPDNLSWRTRKENAADRRHHGTQRSANGEAHPNSKLTEEHVRAIHKWRREGATYGEIADKVAMAHVDPVDISKDRIGEICRGQAWKHVKPEGTPSPATEPTRIPDQPAPTGEGKEIWPIAIEDFAGSAFNPNTAEIEALIVEDMKERDAIGRARYGTPLRAHNGRNALVDGYQEGLDLVAYLTQANEEAEVVGTYDTELAAVYVVLVELRIRMQ